ncbi:sulfotransferase family protein [Mycobacterium sp. ML4]
MQLFIVGAPRSGTTIVTQYLNSHDDITIFDEIDLIQVSRSGSSVVGTLQAFLIDRGVYGAYRRYARETGDPAGALRTVIREITGPCTIWGEKNPRYATQLGALRRTFPEAVPVFVLRDPREVVNSSLAHRNSPMRTSLDFWITDTVAEALELVKSCLQPLETDVGELVVLRYETFAARPKTTVEAALGRWGLTFSDHAAHITHPAPETVGDHQFFRGGSPLPWKVGNLCPLRRASSARERVDPDDPVWARVDALAQDLGYH